MTEQHPLKPFGFLPGYYTNFCKSCFVPFTGAKNSQRCESCAQDARKNYYMTLYTESETKPVVESTSDGRTVNNTVRHQYRVLSDEEKALMSEIKDQGAAFLSTLEKLEPSREVSLAKTKIEEAVMWAVKHVTR